MKKTRKAVTRTQIVRFAGASGDFNPMHHDESFALSAGQPGVFAMGQLQAAMLASMVAEWLGVENVVGFTGGGQRNSGFIFLSLKPLKERKVSADQVVARLRPRLAQEAGANLFLVPVQDIRVNSGRIDWNAPQEAHMASRRRA